MAATPRTRPGFSPKLMGRGDADSRTGSCLRYGLHVMCESERYRDAPPDGGRDLVVVVVVAVVAAVPSNQGGKF